MPSKPRDVRRFGPGPYLLGLEPTGDPFPFPVAALENVEDLSLDQPVTLLAGDNGTGKSTLTEACAEAFGFDLEGGELERSGQLPATPRLAFERTLKPVLDRWSRPRTGYFLRAESFFNVAAYTDSDDVHAPDLSLYGDTPLHQQSHGQSFLALASHRFQGQGLYILDEPEAALSTTGNLALLSVIHHAARQGAQFIIATHSPILLALPGATIYELGEDGVERVAYEDLEAVQFMKGFLNAPERYLRAALGDE
jgi:predicted ATPase